MNDDQIERLLRDLPTPELPAAWRAEILSISRRRARVEKPAGWNWPPILPWLWHRLARNPVTTGVLAMLWLLIFLFRVTTPVDLQEQEILAHADLSKPVYLLTMSDEIRLVEIAEETPAQRRPVP